MTDNVISQVTSEMTCTDLRAFWTKSVGVQKPRSGCAYVGSCTMIQRVQRHVLYIPLAWYSATVSPIWKSEWKGFFLGLPLTVCAQFHSNQSNHVARRLPVHRQTDRQTHELGVCLSVTQELVHDHLPLAILVSW